MHAGTHKTGTSSIQAAFADNRRWLVERGFVFPEIGGGISHNRFAFSVAQVNAGTRKKLGALLSRSVKSGATTVLSAEEISARILGSRDWDGYSTEDHWQRKLGYLRSMREVLSDFDDITVNLCFRRPDKFAESLYVTLILANRFSGSFEQFLTAIAPLFEFRRQVEAFETVFGEVRIISFDAIVDDLIPKFCDWIGVPTPPEGGLHRKKTPDKRLINWFLRTNSATRKDSRGRILLARFTRTRPAADLFADRPPATLWRDEAARQAFIRDHSVGMPDGFFRTGPAKESVSAELNELDMARVTNAFMQWRSAQRSWNSQLSHLWKCIREAPP